MKVAIVGATGLVGQEMIKVLEERNFPLDELIPCASERSVGKVVRFNNKEYKVISVEDAIQSKPQIALFSAGGSISKKYAEAFAEANTSVIDNSSAWRMHGHIKLVVPEVNGDVLRAEDKIIANPNCSTIQLVAAIAPMHRKYKIKRLVISTYQSVTGSGIKGVKQLEDERKGVDADRCYPHPIDLNCLPHGGDFEENGYTSEEIKLVNETRKILADDQMGITSTVVRVPVLGGHSESVNVEFEKEFKLNTVVKLLKESEGLIVQDDVANNVYPMPIHTKGKDETFVGRIRRDESQPKTLNMWIVADNLRKGAATNAVQIAEYLLTKGLAG